MSCSTAVEINRHVPSAGIPPFLNTRQGSLTAIKRLRTQNMMLLTGFTVVAFYAALTLCMVSGVAAALDPRSCSLLNAPPSYTFIGGGFHMQLAIDYPVGAKEVIFTFDLPKSFFIDEAEAEQLYRAEIVSDDPARQGTSAVVVKDVTAAYAPLEMTSQYFFDIEAPVFKVNYSTNHVLLTLQQQQPSTSSVLEAYLGSKDETRTDQALLNTAVKARLVIPIHSRYDILDTTTPFSLKSFVLGESAYAHRCLPKIDMRGVADERCGGKAFASTSSGSLLPEGSPYQTCLELPVGLLSDLPYVYRALMGLLVAGAVIVISAIR